MWFVRCGRFITHLLKWFCSLCRMNKCYYIRVYVEKLVNANLININCGSFSSRATFTNNEATKKKAAHTHKHSGVRARPLSLNISAVACGVWRRRRRRWRWVKREFKCVSGKNEWRKRLFVIRNTQNIIWNSCMNKNHTKQNCIVWLRKCARMVNRMVFSFDLSRRSFVYECMKTGEIDACILSF